MTSLHASPRTFAVALIALVLAWLPLPPMAHAQKAPDGFQVDLIYQAPDIEHPSVVTCDDAGNLFVGEDPMDMRGPTTSEFDRVIYIQWDAQGRPARKTVFCDKLSAVFGLVWLDGALYVMHAPHYTMFKDTDGDGVADVRRELADGFGPPAGVYGFNDHIVTGTQLGLDGFVYVSVGDKGIQKATGADGSTITLEGGGVVRMRPDGTRLEVVSSGTRNHLDVAMDSLDNMFTYDNTDDGLGWWTRFTHHIPTGYYGYPYDYHPHPERHLPRISEHGGGSPVGAACYREAAWPAKYRDSAFHCEWGKRKIQRFTVHKRGATFDAEMEDFMVPAEGSEFRPQDLCFSPDGRYMYVADWNYGGWTRPDRVGRLYRVSYVGGDVSPEPPRIDNDEPIDRQIAALGHPARSERSRAQHNLERRGREALPALEAVLKSDAGKFAKVHALWALSGTSDADYNSTAPLIAALGDGDADVRAQAARAIGLHRLNPARDALVSALDDSDPTVRLQAAVGLGRIGDPKSARPLMAALDEDDEFARFAVIQALRAINDWEQAAGFVVSGSQQFWDRLILAMTTVYDEKAVQMLAFIAGNSRYPNSRSQALGALADVCRQAAPYETGWWGTQPARNKPARPKDRDWAGTPLVLDSLSKGLADENGAVRLAAIAGLRSIGQRAGIEKIHDRLADSDDDVRIEAMRALAEYKDDQAVPALVAIAADAALSESVRKSAIEAVTAIGSPAAVDRLAALVSDPNASPELVALSIDAVSKLKHQPAAPAVEARLADGSPLVRIHAIDGLANLLGSAAAPAIGRQLDAPDAGIRQAALKALARLQARDQLAPMLAAVAVADTRFDAILALASMPDRRALAAYLEGVADKSPELRDASRKALIALGSSIDEDLIALADRRELTAAAKLALQSVVSQPTPIVDWQIVGPWKKSDAPYFDVAAPPDLAATFKSGKRTVKWKKIATHDEHGRVNLESLRPQNDAWVFAYAAIDSPVDAATELSVGSDDQLVVWVNGAQVYEHRDSRSWGPGQATVPVNLKQGLNHLWIKCGNDSGPWDFSVAVARQNPKFAFLYESVAPNLDPGAYRDFALKESGDPARGQKLFADRQGVACVKCHAIGGDGGQVGPDLTGVGAKYPREELIRSVLEPSNRILSGYQLSIVATDAGQVYQGIIKNETDDELELLDAEGRTQRIAKNEVAERETGNVSMMPAGLKDGLSLADFTDVVAYLESLKSEPARTAGAK